LSSSIPLRVAVALALVACTTALPALAATPTTAAAPARNAVTPTVLVDDFETIDAWSAHPADGVELTIGADAGENGRAMRLDFKFTHGAGYAVARRAVDLELPENYRFRFRMKAKAPVNNLEFKLLDASGENVWWLNQRDFHFTEDWQTVTIRKRQISFAWGPQGGGEIHKVAAIELAITAGTGGEGTVWLDDLQLELLPPPSAPQAPSAIATSSLAGHGIAMAVDGDSTTYWQSAAGVTEPWVIIDLHAEREFGGLVIDWLPRHHASDYAIETSTDAERWQRARTVRNGNGGRDYLFLPESEARYLKLRALGPAPAAALAIREINVQPLEWSSSMETFYHSIAKGAPLGRYPRSMVDQQTYWSVIGVDGANEEALLSEDGALETGKAQFSIEPFLFTGGKLVTWRDATITQSLDQGYLPIPSVRWKRASLDLTVTAFATGRTDASFVVAHYRVTNHAKAAANATLYLALRPFQVNPAIQFLNTPGGTARIRSLERDGSRIHVNDDREIVSLTAPAGFSAATFDQGDVTEFLSRGRLPVSSSVRDSFEHASGALAYALSLAPGQSRDVFVLVPLAGKAPANPPEGAGEWVARQLDACRQSWHEKLDRVTISLPDTTVANTLKSQLAWILINRDGAAIQPGSRAYERSWIRDGSLTSTALLRLGHDEDVRAFIEWFAGYLYPNGKVPCCVDRRGSDPVPEHDSSGEFIYLVAEYYRYTGDRELAEKMWPAVRGAATYLDSLRQQRRTAEYRAEDKKEFFGLLPPSISHEGYSAKPMHSYWDDFFALKGFEDAAFLAKTLGRAADAEHLGAIHDEFQHDLVASIVAAQARHKIDYIPGCADLGDFDATSTTIALEPVGAIDALPRAAVDRTFEKYWEYFDKRRKNAIEWTDYTPYETRVIGSFVRLGERDRANAALEFFMHDRRPAGWNQWAEVVGRDPRAPRFIGDMPHTWVGSDFARSLLDMLAYETDSTLVIAAGMPRAWVEKGQGVVVRGLKTRFGPLGYTMRMREGTLELKIDGGVRVPPGGIVVRAPAGPGGLVNATIDGRNATPTSAGEIVVRGVPASLELR
jgi:F5/8 type C domain